MLGVILDAVKDISPHIVTQYCHCYLLRMYLARSGIWMLSSFSTASE